MLVAGRFLFEGVRATYFTRFDWQNEVIDAQLGTWCPDPSEGSLVTVVTKPLSNED